MENSLLAEMIKGLFIEAGLNDEQCKTLAINLKAIQPPDTITSATKPLDRPTLVEMIKKSVVKDGCTAALNVVMDLSDFQNNNQPPTAANAKNGLNVAADGDIELGGALVKNTFINGATGNEFLYLYNLFYFVAQAQIAALSSTLLLQLVCDGEVKITSNNDRVEIKGYAVGIDTANLQLSSVLTQRTYPNHAAADNDNTLTRGSVYFLSTDRVLYVKRTN